MAAKPRSTGNRGVALLPLLPLTPRKLDLAHRLQVSGMLDQAAQPKSVRVCKLSSVQLSRSSARQSPLRPARPSSSSIVLRYCAKPWSCVLLLTEVGPEGRLPAILPACFWRYHEKAILGVLFSPMMRIALALAIFLL